MANLSNNTLYAALNKLSVGIILIDDEQRLIYFNQCISDYSGLTLLEQEGRFLGDIFLPYNDSRLSDACESALLLGLPTRLSHTFNPTPLPFYQKNFVGNDEHLLQQQISVKRISNQNNKPICQIVIADVTHVVKKEKTLQKLADDNIIQRKKAEVANISKSQFLANMSHEIRTPINGVLGMLTLLSDTQLNKTQQHFAKLASMSAEALLYLINDILDFSKIEAGKLDIEHIAFNLPDCIFDSVQALSLQAQQKNVEVIIDSSTLNTNFAIGDPSRLRQIITNLMSNAIKFTEQGEIVIKVETQQSTINELTLMVQVSDTGIGIPSGKCADLFNAFTQVDASTTREYGGTGLGLTIVKQLCQLMGGDISAESQQGQGSNFSFTLTLGIGDQIVTKLKSYDEKPVLVLTPNISQSNYLTKQLECWQLDVVNGSVDSDYVELCKKIESDYFSVLLLDENLASDLLDSITSAQENSSNNELVNTQVILLTPMDKSYDRKNSVISLLKKNDCLQQISKPVKVSQLHQLLNNAFSLGEDLKANLALQDDKSEKNIVVHEKAKILVVEDNRINQEVALGLLRKIGYRAEVAKHGLHALELLTACDKSDPYNIILMDCQMPEMDGYQTTIAIRSDEKYKEFSHINIIAMTANTMAGDQDKCLAAGMNDYLPKPINPSLLTKKLDYWLGKLLS